MSDEEKRNETDHPFDYMEDLSKAYEESFAKRLRSKRDPLPEEKRDLLARMQLEVRRVASRLASVLPSEEKKELARMIEESAEETLQALRYDEKEVYPSDPFVTLPIVLALSRAVLLANRCLNLLVRHREAEERIAHLLLSELSALYALAAIN